MARTPKQETFEADRETIIKHAGMMVTVMDLKKNPSKALTDVRAAATKAGVHTEALKMVLDWMRGRTPAKRVLLISKLREYIDIFGADREDQISIDFGGPSEREIQAVKQAAHAHV